MGILYWMTMFLLGCATVIISYIIVAIVIVLVAVPTIMYIQRKKADKEDGV